MKKLDQALNKIILDIENSSVQQIEKRSVLTLFELRSYDCLISNLVGGEGTFFIRAILYFLNIDEHHVFKWRLENKFIQYTVLNHYVPGCMPDTISFSILMKQKNGKQKIRDFFEKGFFLKATLGECSGKHNTFDRTGEFEEAVILHDKKFSYKKEKWILQKKLKLRAEFRIHTFTNDIIYGLTFKITGLVSLNNYHAEHFVKSILDRLPPAVTEGTLIAWDIGLTTEGKYYVIESNFTGFHPEFNYGFQTSGYFQDEPFGPISCALLNNYIKHKYNTGIRTVNDQLLLKASFHESFLYYQSLFTLEHYQIKSRKNNNKIFSVILYLGEQTNSRIIKLIEYLFRANYADYYYVIAKEEYLNEIELIYLGNEDVKILGESTFFTTEKYFFIKQLIPRKRKSVNCYQALRKIKNTDCVVI